MKYNKQMSRQLNKILDEIFHESDVRDLTLRDFAMAANLSYTTVQRINACTTYLPRFQTIEKLAHAVGMVIEVKTNVTLRKPMHKLKPKVGEPRQKIVLRKTS
jgi:hypothetical protein